MALVLVDLKQLKEHEEIEPQYLEKMKKQILRDKVLKKPIVVDENSKIILDGHFRYNVLKQLGYSKIPAYFLDYRSSEIIVKPWRNDETVTKEDVIRAGLTGKKLPTKTSKHMFKLSDNQIRIAKILKRVNIPLNELR